MNLFTTPAFLETAGHVFHPGRSHRVEVCRVGGLRLPLLVIDGREVMQRAPFYDFPQPLEGPHDGPLRELSYFPRTVVATSTVEARVPEAPGYQPSPYVAWSRFPSWADFEAFVGQRIGNLFPDSRRRRKRLARDVGPVRFTFDDERPEVFEACLRWKSAQYVASGLPDLFADRRNVELFRQLRARGVVVVSSLSAGDALLAAHLGGLSDERLYWWVPTYDVEWARYSPGRLLLEDLLQASHARRHAEFDFLIGDEAYKFHYATHSRVIGPVGVPPLGAQLRAEARRRVKRVVEASPRVKALLDRLRGRA
jgi:hypothetical protein